MNPRQACLTCLDRTPVAWLEAALWVAAEHTPLLDPTHVLRHVDPIEQELRRTLPALQPSEQAQPLLRQLNAMGFQQDEYLPLRPHAALMDQVLKRRRGQPLMLAMLALELAERLGIPLHGVNFPGHFLLQVPGADHWLDPCGGRRLYLADCRALLIRQFGAQAVLSAAHVRTATPRQMFLRLSRNLRHLHDRDDNPMAALIDAERVMVLGGDQAADYLARADLYHRLNCPTAERYDVERALLLTDDPVQSLALSERLGRLPADKPALH